MLYIAMQRGLTRAHALEALTSIPARILGLENRLGNIQEGKLANFIISSGDPLDPESTIIYGFSTLGAITLEKVIVIQGMQHVTSMAEDPQTGTLWVAGFNMHDIPQYPNPTQPAFYYPHLASVSFENDDVQLLPLFDPWSHDLALPMSILWTGTDGQSAVQ